MSDTTNPVINVVMFGDGTVGKTCILSLFVDNEFIEVHNETIFEIQEITVELDRRDHRLRLHDTAGQEVYTRLRRTCMVNRHLDVFILCYSVDNRNSYENITNRWIEEIGNRGAPIILVATKTDLRNRLNHISNFEGVLLQQRIGARAFIECSSLNNTNINEVFFEAIKAAIPTVQQNSSNSSWLIVQVKKIFCC